MKQKGIEFTQLVIDALLAAVKEPATIMHGNEHSSHWYNPHARIPPF
jgi:hypothetical protein